MKIEELKVGDSLVAIDECVMEDGNLIGQQLLIIGKEYIVSEVTYINEVLVFGIRVELKITFYFNVEGIKKNFKLKKDFSNECEVDHELLESHLSKQAFLKKQVGGTYYSDMKIQPIDFIIQNNLGYIEGNIVKYISRYKNKNGLEDLRKAQQYLDILILTYEGD